MHVLYRFYDASGRLLYVGRTHRIEGRIAQHRREKPWGRVETIRLEHFPDHDSLCLAEAAAIKGESPEWNIVVPGGPSRNGSRGDDAYKDTLAGRIHAAFDRVDREAKFDTVWEGSLGDSCECWDYATVPFRESVRFPDVIVRLGDGSVSAGYSCFCGRQWTSGVRGRAFDWEYRLLVELMSLRLILAEQRGADPATARHYTLGYDGTYEDYKPLVRQRNRRFHMIANIQDRGFAGRV